MNKSIYRQLPLVLLLAMALVGCGTNESSVETVKAPAEQSKSEGEKAIESNPNVPDVAKQGMGIK